MNDQLYGELSVIGMLGSEDFIAKVDAYLREWRGSESFLLTPEMIRFGTGEGKCVLRNTVRGHDIYIFADLFNWGVTFNMYGMEVPMSPDDHFSDLKRIIGAIMGKARRVSVIMPMLYEGRQHRRTLRESLDCAMMLQELVKIGVSNIITFDAHDARVQNAIPLSGFDDVRTTYQMIKALLNNVPDITLDSSSLMVISPDEGGIGRCMYLASILELELGMFYKRRDYSVIKNGKNPIVEHKFLGSDVHGHDIIIVDDMISSGESVLTIAAQLKQMGARRVFAFVSFGLFTSGLESFDKAYDDKIIDKIFTTNLIYRNPALKDREWYVEVDLTKYVAYIIDTLNRDSTISKLLDPSERINNFIQRWEEEKNQTKLDI
ncbi:MAG TPA: ribose-phosphate pyrophosphokinase [Clostridiales bacterium]|jgi:ribose-phosphate pyrophosphokinase|nr:ribose-phosphate pyrophosphokinase [Clostridiales bacterium]